MFKQFSKYQIATAIAIFFHLIGLIGMLIFNRDFFVQSTAFNLLLSAALLVYTHTDRNKYFYFFAAVAVLVGFSVEVVGVNTGKIFGEYSYGNSLGFKWQGVPLIIGVNWFIIIYCSGICLHTFLTKIIIRVATDRKEPPMVLKAMSVIMDGATLAVFFDWLMEPVAIKLGYWKWVGGDIPVYNYICWFIVSFILLAVFHFSKFNKDNKFAINLLLIQAMFFLVLRTFLK